MDMVLANVGQSVSHIDSDNDNLGIQLYMRSAEVLALSCGVDLSDVVSRFYRHPFQGILWCK